MTTERVVLITGAAGQWGTRLANRLAAEPDLRVVALDDQPPSPGLAGIDYVQADFRGPLIGDFMAAEGVHTVCHLAFRPAIHRSAEAYDYNVTGTRRFLNACATAGVQQVIFMSSTAVYGAQPDNPVLLSETRPLRGSSEQETIRDLLEIEAFTNGFAHEHPEMTVTNLRFANIVGPGVDTQMTRYLRRHAAPFLMGFNPVMQLIHAQDVLEALAHAVLTEAGGNYNVAAEPVMPLKRLLALAGTTPMPVFHLLAYRNRPVQNQLVFEPDYLRYRWVADTAKMQTELGFFPEKSAEEALQDFRAGKGEPLPPSTHHNGSGRGHVLPLDEIISLRQMTRARHQAGGATIPDAEA